MKAIVPCAKQKENLFPFIDSRPTGLMPLAGRNIVRRLVSQLRDAGVEEVILVSNYMIGEYREVFGSRDDVRVVEQEETSGVGDAVLVPEVDDNFLVVNGDVYISEGNIDRLADRLRAGEQAVLGAPSSHAEKFGVLSIHDDTVTAVNEKPENPENNLVNTGIYALQNSFLRRLEDEEGNLVEALRRTAKEEDLRIELVEGTWRDIGSPEKLMDAGTQARRNLEPKVSDQADIHRTAHVSPDARVEAGAEIRPGAAVLGHSYVGEESVVGANSVVKDSSVHTGSQVIDADVRESAVWEDVVVDPNTSVQRSILAEESVVRSGTSIRQSFIGPRSHVDVNNSIRGVKFVPDARTDLSEISK